VLYTYSPGPDTEENCACLEQVLQPKRSTAEVLAADSIYTSFNLTAP